MPRPAIVPNLAIRRIKFRPPSVAENTGPDATLWGSDAATGGNLPPGKAWTEFRKIPLTSAEFHLGYGHEFAMIRSTVDVTPRSR